MTAAAATGTANPSAATRSAVRGTAPTGASRDDGYSSHPMIITAVAVDLAAKIAVWRDLAVRPVSQIRGPRWMWAILALFNYIGPTSYFSLGRRRS